MKRVIQIASVAVCMIAFASGCSPRQAVFFWATRPLMEGGMAALMAETDPVLGKIGMESELKLLEGMLTLHPGDRSYLLYAAQGFASYAMLFLDDEEPSRARIHYDRARNYGSRALADADERFLVPDVTYDQFTQALRHLREDDLPFAYWTAVAWAGGLNLDRSSPKSVAEMSRVVALMQWVYDRNPEIYFSGPRWFFGVYYCSLPPILGGGAGKALPFFKAALESDGDRFLWGRMLYARYYAVATNDRSLFETTLDDIIARSSPDAPPELNLINAVALERAAWLRQQSSDLF